MLIETTEANHAFSNHGETYNREDTREGWLNRCAALMVPWFEELGYEVPAIRVSIGFTSKGARSNRIGECWDSACSADGVYEIFLVPSLSDSSRIADILAHEMVHAVVGIAAKHGPKFRKCATTIGLEGKMACTTAGPRFLERIKPILEEVGEIPHKTLRGGSNTSPKKQPTRMLKCECSDCGYVVRTTAKWLEFGAPVCPVDGIAMTAEE